MHPIVVFSHLRWDFVYQRPQHLLSRLASKQPVVFIEEPVLDAGEPWLEALAPCPGVTVYRPHTPVETHGFHDDQLPILRTLLADLFAQHADCIAWFYTPMALPLLKELDARTVVYDCMDELSAFHNAPRQLTQRETALLKLAHVVFTGGPSLFEAKKDRHPNAHCFISSVNAADFAPGKDAANEIGVQRHLPRPRIGFYGVVDERFDTALLAKLADLRPQWQFVVVGPVVKIDPASLPQRENIHYFGKRDYTELAGFLAGWDIAMLPFALNESTRYISPTKVLEYMAAEKPIVSTRITDVDRPYAGIVDIADTAEDFVAACERRLAESDDERQARVAAMQRVVATTSWDATVERMQALMDAAAASAAPTEIARALLQGEQASASGLIAQGSALAGEASSATQEVRAEAERAASAAESASRPQDADIKPAASA